MGESNRRSFFRLDDQMQIKMVAIDKSKVSEIIEDFESYRIKRSLKSYFNVQKSVRSHQKNIIRKQSSDIADYFEHLENLLQLIAIRIGDDEADPSRVGEVLDVPVSLSRDGICFSTTYPLEVGEIVELSLRLSSSDVRVLVLASVTRIEESSCNDSVLRSVAFSFFHVHKDDKEMIIQHMAKLQQLQLQARQIGQQAQGK